MGVALSTLVPTLQRTLNPPGSVLFTAGTSEWVGRLADAFWNARLQDFFVGYVIDPTNNQVIPINAGGADLSRDMQSAIVQFAALTALRMKLLQTTTMSRSKAGTVEVETQRSATLLVALLKDVSDELTQLRLRVLADAAAPGSVTFLDAMVISANRTIAGSGYGGYGGYENLDYGFVNG